MTNAIIEDHIARNSLAIYATSGCAALTSILLLVPKLFPQLLGRLALFKLSQLESQNGLKRAGSTSTSPAAQRRPISSLRMYLIIISALLMIADAINSCIMVASVWSTGTANWVEFHTFRALSFFPAGPIFTVGLAQRIAVIVVMSPSWQKWFLRTVYVVCIWVSLQQQAFMIFGTLQLASRQGVTDKEWYDAFFIPQWSTAIVAVIPVITIGGSLWSLKIAFRHSKVQPSAASVGQSGSTTGGLGGSSAGEGTGSSSGGVTVVVPSSTLAGLNMANKSIDNLSLNGSRSMENLSRFGGGPPTTNQPTTLGQHSVAFTIKYALTTTFKMLTYLMLLWWILFLVMITLRNSPLPFRSSAMSSMIVSFALITESSFEWLLKMRRKRQLHQHSRAAASREHLGPSNGRVATVRGSREQLHVPSPLGRSGVGVSRELFALPESLLGVVHGKNNVAEDFHRPSF